LLGAVIVLLPVFCAWRMKAAPDHRRQVWTLWMAAVIPIALVGVGLMIYNAARFDNPFEFGWRYQLGGTRQDQGQFLSWRYLWFNFRTYFLAPVGWVGHFPFVQRNPVVSLLPGHAGVGDIFGGILINLPVVWLALAAPLTWKDRAPEAGFFLRWFLGSLALLAGITVAFLCLFFAAFTRYEMGFLPSVALLAVAGILGLERALIHRPRRRLAARWVWISLLVYSVGLNLLIGIECQTRVRSNFGYVLMQSGRLEEALAHLRQGLEIQPNDAGAHNNLGGVLVRMGRVEEAKTEFEAALRINPGYVLAHNNLGTVLLQAGQLDAATVHFQKALEIQPGSAALVENLRRVAWVWGTHPQASVRNGAKALELAEQLNQLSGGTNALVLTTLAAASAEAGRLREAVTVAQEALQWATLHNDASLVEALQPQIACYQAGSPWRDQRLEGQGGGTK
jgi:tetratricopeptide (TPR) repeat protein